MYALSSASMLRGGRVAVMMWKLSITPVVPTPTTHIVQFKYLTYRLSHYYLSGIKIKGIYHNNS